MCLNKIQVRNRGFTLVEAMIAIAIFAIIMAFAIPNFNNMIQRNKNRTDAATLQSALNLARYEALTQGASVQVSAVSGSWHSGMTITLDSNSNGAFNDSEDLEIKKIEALAGVTADSVADNIIFNAKGENAFGAAQKITLTPKVCKAGDKQKREITISLTGLVKVTKLACS